MTRKVGGNVMKSTCRIKRDVCRKPEDGIRKQASLPAAIGTHGRTETFPPYFAAAVGLSSDAIVVTDPRGYIQYVNTAFEQMTGYIGEEAAGRSLHILDSGRHDGEFYECVRKTLAREGIWRGRLVSKKKDGTLYHEECTHSLVKGPSGETTYHLSVRRDVTERLKLESIVEEIDTTKNCGYILSGVRHEIGNSVNSLAAILGVLKAKLARLDTPAIAGYLESASDEAQKAAYILRCLRNYNIFTKPEIQGVRLPEFMAKFLALVRDDLAAKGIGINASIDANVEQCCADPRALHQVMLNLLINATDALEGRAHPRVSIRISKSGENVRVTVEDNGCGMSEDHLRNMFKPFYTTKAHGTGLGLVIIKKLLTAMNGSIAVRSFKDIGTTIDIIIPGERVMTGNTAEALPAAAGL